MKRSEQRPRLPAGPFRRWLHDYMERHALTMTDVARMTDYHDRMIRALYHGERPTIQERTVERIGIALALDPRVTEEIYPHLDEAA